MISSIALEAIVNHLSLFDEDGAGSSNSGSLSKLKLNRSRSMCLKLSAKNVHASANACCVVCFLFQARL